MAVSPGHTQIPQGSSDFLLEVAKGSIPGHIAVPVGAQTPFATNASFLDIWDFNTDLVYATSAESLEIVSDNANDSSAGTGAQEITVEGLNSDFELADPVVVATDGLTPVSVPGTYMRTSSLAVSDAGSTGGNEGNITLRVSGGGADRLRIRTNLQNSFSSHRTIPAGSSGFVIILNESCPRNDSIRVRVAVRPEDGVFQLTTPRYVYQNSFTGALLATPLLPEKTDIKFIARADSPNSEISISYQVVLIDNAYVPNASDPSLEAKIIGASF